MMRSLGDAGDAVPTAMSYLSPVYQPTVQQGNVITQRQVNQLKPGMDKGQVNFIMGTPLLVDAFHSDRWDYYYSIESEGVERTHEYVTLYFQNNRLVRIDGDYRPRPVDITAVEEEETVVTVPDQPHDEGWVTWMLDKMRVGEDS